MERVKSNVYTIKHNINTVFDKLSDPARYKQLLEANADKLPAHVREHLDKITFGQDYIAINSPMGPVKLGINMNETVAPTRIVYSAMESPVKFGLAIELTQLDESHTQEMSVIELDLPFFVAKMIGPKLQDGAEKFGEMLSKIPYDTI